MTKRLRIGYVPLTDAALLHVAKAQHFAAARGVEIELVADSSWANIRDKLVAGHFDAAHMLAPANRGAAGGAGGARAQRQCHHGVASAFRTLAERSARRGSRPPRSRQGALPRSWQGAASQGKP